MRVFLGGTCNNTTWREDLMPVLEKLGYDYFNPVVEDWTPECVAVENQEREVTCGVKLFVITSAMRGVVLVE